MGTSNWQNISYCVGLLRRLKPASVLDVGTGFGRWGVLCREFLDVWDGREARGLWQTRIEGIEAFPGCLTPLHGYIYDRLHVGDAVELLPTLGAFDVVYLGDVVEHQTKDRAWQLLDEAVRHARQAAIVTIPIGEDWPQEMGWDGNTYHPHRSIWQVEDFDRYPGVRRRAFSDYIGRMFLVAELPGQADAVSAPRSSVSVEPSSASHLSRLPASVEIRRCLAELEAKHVPWAAPLAAAVDAVFTHAVAMESTRPAPTDDVSAPPHLVEVIERLSAAVSTLLADGRQGAPVGERTP